MAKSFWHTMVEAVFAKNANSYPVPNLLMKSIPGILFSMTILLASGQSVPGTLSYQGILMQSDGVTPLNDDTYGVQFTFYNSSGTPLGGVSVRTINVTTAKGLFSCIIGGATGSNAPFGASEISTISSQKSFIGIRVDLNKNATFEESELSPRAELTPATYSFQAQSAYTISDNAITSAKIADGVIVNADINGSAAIADTKLATITTAGKVSGSAITSGTIGGTTSINTTGAITGGDIAGATLSSTSIISNSTFLAFSLNGQTAGRMDFTQKNTFLGYQAGLTASASIENTVFGHQALRWNTTGSSNTAIGLTALYNNTTGVQNTAIGGAALESNTAGERSTAIGFYTLPIANNSNGYNTAIGYGAGSSVTTGTVLTLLGYNAQPSTPTAFGEVVLGDANVSVLRCNTSTISALSDMRDKKQIKDLELGIDFIMKLKPRQFNWDRRDWYFNNLSDGSKMIKTPTAGFIAQELDEAQKGANSDWLELVYKNNPEKWEATYGKLLPVIVKAIQEQQTQIEDLTSTNKILVQQLQAVEVLLNKVSGTSQVNHSGQKP